MAVRLRLKRTKAIAIIIAYYRRYKLKSFLHSIIDLFRYVCVCVCV